MTDLNTEEIDAITTRWVYSTADELKVGMKLLTEAGDKLNNTFEHILWILKITDLHPEQITSMGKCFEKKHAKEAATVKAFFYLLKSHPKIQSDKRKSEIVKGLMEIAGV